ATATWENATLRIFDQLLADARIDLTVREPDGSTRKVQLDVRGREAELTEPAALFTGLGVLPGPVLPAVIDSVTPDSPAAAAGLKAGDQVVAVGDKPITSWDQWVNQIKQRPGETVDITVRRDGAERTVPVAIGSVQDG